jgi:DNA-binding transcriptional ArsR family regulator
MTSPMAKRSKKTKRMVRKHVSGRIMTPALIAVLNHPTRRRILRMLNTEKREQSPKDAAKALRVGLGEVSFHFRVLRELKVIDCVKTSRVRGATQHFYRSRVIENELVGTILRETEADDGH